MCTRGMRRSTRGTARLCAASMAAAVKQHNDEADDDGAPIAGPGVWRASVSALTLSLEVCAARR